MGSLQSVPNTIYSKLQIGEAVIHSTNEPKPNDKFKVIGEGDYQLDQTNPWRNNIQMVMLGPHTRIRLIALGSNGEVLVDETHTNPTSGLIPIYRTTNAVTQYIVQAFGVPSQSVRVEQFGSGFDIWTIILIFIIIILLYFIFSRYWM